MVGARRVSALSHLPAAVPQRTRDHRDGTALDGAGRVVGACARRGSGGREAGDRRCHRGTGKPGVRRRGGVRGLRVRMRIAADRSRAGGHVPRRTEPLGCARCGRTDGGDRLLHDGGADIECASIAVARRRDGSGARDLRDRCGAGRKRAGLDAAARRVRCAFSRVRPARSFSSGGEAGLRASRRDAADRGRPASDAAPDARRARSAGALWQPSRCHAERHRGRARHAPRHCGRISRRRHRHTPGLARRGHRRAPLRRDARTGWQPLSRQRRLRCRRGAGAADAGGWPSRPAMGQGGCSRGLAAAFAALERAAGAGPYGVSRPAAWA